MNQKLLQELIEFNKKKPEMLREDIEIVKAKICGGFRLTLSSMSNSLSLEQPKEEEFWSDLENCVDGKKYVKSLRKKLAGKYTPSEVLEGLQELYQKPGCIQDNRKIVLEKMPENAPINSTIYCWPENCFANAQSNMVFTYVNEYPLFIGNIYSIKIEEKYDVKEKLDNLIASIKSGNVKE